MKTQTLYSFYKAARSEMETAIDQRSGPLMPGRFGIAASKDPAALRYQRAERIAHKLNMRIMARLGWDFEYDDENPLCAGCYYSMPGLKSRCTPRPVKHFDAWEPRDER